MILLCITYLLARTVVSKVRGLLCLITSKSWGCCNSLPAKQGFTIVIYSNRSVYHICTCVHIWTHTSHMCLCPRCTQHSHWLIWHQWPLPIPLNAWFWGSGKDPCTPASTCTCIMWISPEAGLVHLTCPSASYGPKSSLLSHLDKWATETPGSLQLLVQTSHTFTPTLIPAADIPTHINTPELKMEGNKRGGKTVDSMLWSDVCWTASHLFTCPFHCLIPLFLSVLVPPQSTLFPPIFHLWFLLLTILECLYDAIICPLPWAVIPLI